MRDIYIYGEVIPFSDKWVIDEGGYVNLDEVQRQLNEADGEDVKVIIRSPGGCVQTGFDIYNALRRYAKEKGARVETFGEGIVSSIATVIFLAGDKRTLTENTYPFVHNAWTYTWEGMDSKKFQRIADDLKQCDARISKHYAMHTDLTEEEALELMNNDTSISPEEAKRIRFATDIEEVFRPVALKRFNINKIDNKMSNKAKQLIKAAKSLLGINNKVVETADGKELDFYELAEDATPAVGDKAYYDGMDADGSFIMPDGETFVFIAGVLEEIESEDETDTNEALAEANATIAELEETITGLMAKVEQQGKTIKAYQAKSKPAPASEKAKSGEDNKEKNKQAESLDDAVNNLIKKK